jgi:hypothetical protein
MRPPRALSIILVSAAQFTAGILLYRQRALTRWSAGDWLVLYLPVIAAAITHTLLMWSEKRKRGNMLQLAIGGTALAVAVWFVTLLLNLNVFGS